MSSAARLPYADDDREQQPLELLAETAVEMVRRACKHGVAAQMRAGLLAIPELDLAPAVPPAPVRPQPDEQTRWTLAAELVGLKAIRTRRLSRSEAAALDAAIARVHALLKPGADA